MTMMRMKMMDDDDGGQDHIDGDGACTILAICTNDVDDDINYLVDEERV